MQSTMRDVLYIVNYKEIKNCKKKKKNFLFKSAWFLNIHECILMKLFSIQSMKIDKKVSEKNII